eukprot:TRINITY_DN60159_c0_g1_i1.p1 TRINITY_DN60159_c0_g1~~TRINITY_DN60159_c0_g1_i1.p1  ORF type:complete len:234 (-),score=26.85 TRINITY_DN60159_c0_g1_i1:351-1052(-)
MSKGIVHSVTRTIRGELEAADFEVEGVPPVRNAKILREEGFTPMKTSPDYTSEHPAKIVTIGFDALAVSQEVQQLRFSFRLTYNSRLFEADCKALGAEQCGRWLVSKSGSEVAHLIATSNVSVSCLAPAPETCATTREAEDGFYNVLIQLPDLQLGTDKCPFAWKKSPQSWTWWVGACFLALGASMMFLPTLGSTGGGDKVCFVLFCGGGLFCCMIGGIVCAVAIAQDKVFSD